MKKKSSPIAKGITLSTLYTIYLFDVASTVLVLVIFSALLLSPTSHFVALNTPTYTRSLLLGFLYASYPLAQFFGAPILGELSDRLGKKTILNISTFFTALAYFFTALCILSQNLPLLFLSRLIAGFFSGNVSIAQATVSSIVTQKNRARAMAFFSVCGGVGWIIGPFLGTLLSNSKIVPWFNFSTPFWLFGMVFFLSWGSFIIFYESNFIRKPEEKLSLTQIYKNIFSIFKHKIIIAPFFASFIAMFGLTTIDTFFAPFLTYKFGFDHVKIGYAFAYFAAWWLIGGIIATLLFKMFKPSKFITPMLIFSAIFAFIYVMDKTPSFILWAGAIVNFSFSISYAAFITIFSHLMPDESQGKLYGAISGMFALANTLGPAFAGWISFAGINVPIAVGSIILLIAGALYFSWQQRNISTLTKKET